MEDHRGLGPEPDAVLDARDHERKPRRCLRCGAMFDSQWIGERICRRCRGSSAWRRGEPPPPEPRS